MDKCLSNFVADATRKITEEVFQVGKFSLIEECFVSNEDKKLLKIKTFECFDAQKVKSWLNSKTAIQKALYAAELDALSNRDALLYIRKIMIKAGALYFSDKQEGMTLDEVMELIA